MLVGIGFPNVGQIRRNFRLNAKILYFSRKMLILVEKFNICVDNLGWRKINDKYMVCYLKVTIRYCCRTKSNQWKQLEMKCGNLEKHGAGHHWSITPWYCATQCLRLNPFYRDRFSAKFATDCNKLRALISASDFPWEFSSFHREKTGPPAFILADLPNSLDQLHSIIGKGRSLKTLTRGDSDCTAELQGETNGCPFCALQI